jgi:phage terminase large subunit GpA-like protein
MEAMTLVDEVAGTVVARVNAIPARFTRNIEQRAALQREVDETLAEVADRIEELGATFQSGRDDPAADEEGENRVYPLSSGRPGPKDPALTPYMIPFMGAFDDPNYNTVAFVCGGQMGNTDSIIDVVLSRLDQRPVPIIYAGPDRNFVTVQFEPRFDDALNRSKSLSVKFARGNPRALCHASSP